MFGTNTDAALIVNRIPFGSTGVEIGVWKGHGSKLFLRRAGRLHMVDPWSVEPYKQSSDFGGYEAYLKRYQKLVGSCEPAKFQQFYDRIFCEVVKRFRYDPVIIHRRTSTEFFAKFNTAVDWVYVDGLHSFDDCLLDLMGAEGIVKPGGSIFGDDYGNKEGVTKAVDRFADLSGLPVDHIGNQYEIKT